MKKENYKFTRNAEDSDLKDTDYAFIFDEDGDLRCVQFPSHLDDDDELAPAVAQIIGTITDLELVKKLSRRYH